MKIVALICARGNSRGIKNKNLLKFKNTTLLGNAIKQAFGSKYISRVIVSTDSHKIAREALKNKAEVPFVRPSTLAKDNSPEIQTWIHAIKFLNKDKSIDFIVSVPTTSPLRTISDIDNCIERATKRDLDMVFSVTKASKNLSPDLMIILGDRYEILASAIAAHLSRIPIAHLHGGEATEGLVDEALRHSITKMSHIHLVAAQEYKERVVQLGENPNTVFNVGGLGVDNIKCLKFLSKNELERDLNFRFAKKNILINFHPETLNKFSSKRQFNEVLIALKKFNNINLIFTMPNADLDGRIIFRMLKNFVRKNKNACYFTSMGQLQFLSCLKYVDGMIGNSSSGILEMPSFKKGTIDIGDRQLGRLKAKSVISVKPNRNEIIKGIHTLYSKKFQTKIKTTKSPYGEGGANKKIIKILKKIKLKNILKKKFYSLNVRCV